jgi:hypothetical protein
MYETDVFISYKRQDKEFASELTNKLIAKGYKVWLDITNIPYGRDWRTNINKALEGTILVVVVTSPLSMQSAYVTYEWSYASLALMKDFHWIEIDKCGMDDGMYGLLIDKRQQPIPYSSKLPQDEEWNKIIESVENRLFGVDP